MAARFVEVKLHVFELWIDGKAVASGSREALEAAARLLYPETLPVTITMGRRLPLGWPTPDTWRKP